MADFIVMTDSCSDLGKDVREEYDIEYVKMNITYGGKELPASLDWDLYTPQELYGIMKEGTRIMTTQVPASSFMEAFEKHLKEGKDVVYIGCSSALSGSVNTGAVVAQELSEKYPDNKVYCVDALNSCLGEGLQVIDAAVMRSEGKSAKEVYDCLEAERLKYHQFCAIEDLTYLKRAGRVKASAAFFGNLFGVKPILISNRQGENFAVKKVKGRKASLDEIVEMAKATIENPEDKIVAVAHADCIEDAEYIKSRVEKEIKPKRVYVNYIGPIIGASAGPKTVAIYLKGKEKEI